MRKELLKVNRIYKGVDIIFPASLAFKDVVELFDEIIENNYYDEKNVRSFEVIATEDRDFFRIHLKDGTIEDSDYIGGRLYVYESR